MTESRTCTRCGVSKMRCDFYSAGEKGHCRECVKSQRRAAYAADPVKFSQKNRFSKYGMTPERYAALLEQQGGGCAICRRTDPGNPRTKHFFVDHDHSCCAGMHSCGECVRGLLCAPCNTALGLLGDDADRLLSAMSYLQGQGAPA